VNSIDNGYMQAFINHGVPGLLHLAFYLAACWWAIRISKGYPWLHVRQVRIVTTLLFVTYLVYSLSGVRHAKLETSFYWMVAFGLLYAMVYNERWIGSILHVRPNAAPEPSSLEEKPEPALRTA
jgi:hypothetical protein